jgi:hypothetical protein
MTRRVPGFIAPVRVSSSACTTYCGRTATMPAKMISDTPLPTPRLVICSPSHIRNMVPPVRVTTVEMMKNRPGVLDQAGALAEAHGDAKALEHRQHDGQVAGVLVELLAPASPPSFRSFSHGG